MRIGDINQYSLANALLEEAREMQHTTQIDAANFHQRQAAIAILLAISSAIMRSTDNASQS